MNRTEISNCCGAAVTDNGLCSDCGEHYSTIVNETVSVWVLDFQSANVYRMLIPIEYDIDDDPDTYVEDYITDYLGHSSVQRMRTDVEEVDFIDLDLT